MPVLAQTLQRPRETRSPVLHPAHVLPWTPVRGRLHVPNVRALQAMVCQEQDARLVPLQLALAVERVLQLALVLVPLAADTPVAADRHLLQVACLQRAAAHLFQQPVQPWPRQPERQPAQQVLQLALLAVVPKARTVCGAGSVCRERSRLHRCLSPQR